MIKFYPKYLHQQLSNIKLAIFDIDGVLTNGQIYYGAEGEIVKAFSTLDGHGLKMLLRNNIHVAIISGRASKMLDKRMQDLGIKEIYGAVGLKMPIYNQLLQKYNVQKHEVCYMGDDIPDYHILKNCGLSVCPKNAHTIILQNCDWIIDKIGGTGAVRELCDAIVIAKFGIDALINQETT